MKKLIKEYLKVNAYNKGQFYKIVPDVMLKDFVKYVEKREQKNQVACVECGWEGMNKELSSTLCYIGNMPTQIDCCPICFEEELIDL